MKASSINGASVTGCLHEKNANILISPCPRLKSKWIKDPNIKPETPNLIEEKVWDSLDALAQETTSCRKHQQLRH